MEEIKLDLSGKSLDFDKILEASKFINSHFGLPPIKIKGQEIVNDLFLKAIEEDKIDLGI